MEQEVVDEYARHWDDVLVEDPRQLRRDAAGPCRELLAYD